jgi:Matrixin
MHRQLRELDRWYAAGGSPRRGGLREAGRRLVVSLATAAVAVVATLTVLHHEGVVVDLDGIARRVGAGPARASEGSGSFAFMSTQPGRPDVPVTYDPCKPIHLVVNERLAPAGQAEPLLGSALAAVTAATGLDFVRDGVTDELPGPHRAARDRARYGGGWSPVLVAWTTPGVDPGLSGDVAGRGGSAGVSDPLTGERRFVTGTVSLDAPALQAILRRRDGVAEARAILMHELGHVVGLAHVDDPRELMYDDNVGRTEFGPGDLQGLAALGRGPCAG